MTDPGVNVITTEDIPFDTRLGPLPVISNIMDTMVMIGLRCAEIRPMTQQIKIDPKELENVTNSRYFHWLFYVQSARDEGEQNLEVITKHDQLYYRVIRTIRAGEELLVWYSKESAEMYKVPDVQDFYSKDERKYLCPYCNEVFLFSNPLKAHLMYRCEKRIVEVHGLNSMTRLQLDSINRLQLDVYSSAAVMVPMKPNLKGLSITSLANSFLDMYRKTTTSSSIGSVSREKENSEDTNPTQSATDYGHMSPIEAPFKRKTESQGNEMNKRSSRTVLSNNERTKLSSKMESTSLCTGMTQLESNVHQATHIVRNKDGRLFPICDQETSVSAFKKVGKSSRVQCGRSISPGMTYNPCDHPAFGKTSAMYPISYSLPLVTGSPPAAVMAITAAGALSGSSTTTNWTMPISTSGSLQIMDPRSPRQANASGTSLMSSPAIASNFISSKMLEMPSSYANVKFLEDAHHPAVATATTSTTAAPASENGHHRCQAAAYPDSMYRLSVSLPYSGGKQFGTPLDNILGKQPVPAPMPPIAASLLPPSLAALAFPAQNWCAKCNASFRMTSDLVYHMRSHHKREIDPLKKKREEKLKCTICSESFRERHHLTRHMTSHQ